MIEIMCKTEEEVREVKKRFSDCEVSQKNNFAIFGKYAITVKIPQKKERR